MLATWPDKYDKYVSSGMYEDESGHTVGADGLHISADAPEKVKEYFRKRNEGHIKIGWEPPFIIH